MSGGSMDFLYAKVQDAYFRHERSAERRAFRQHLKLVAEALRAIEWNDSGDGNDEREREAIRACIAPGLILQQATEDARETVRELTALIDRAEALDK